MQNNTAIMTDHVTNALANSSCSPLERASGLRATHVVRALVVMHIVHVLPHFQPRSVRKQGTAGHLPRLYLISLSLGSVQDPTLNRALPKVTLR